MKKLLLTMIYCAIAFSMIAQVPQGFNYQGVARNSEGAVLANANISVRIGILNNDALAWQEDHDVTTNTQGLFSLIIGSEDASKTGGSVSAFIDIPWGNGDFAMEVSIDNGNGYTSMGRSPVMSVPFAMYAAKGGNQDLQYNEGVLSLSDDPTPDPINLDNIISAGQNWAKTTDTLHTNMSVGIGTENPNQSLLAIQSNDPQVKIPLFEVRNNEGIPVFAVYNDGVMVLVDESSKGVKGGFAVGGYNSNSKGMGQEYLRITPDSVRIYVPDKPAVKGVKGGFAVGGYNNAKSTPVNLLEVTSAETNVYFDTTYIEKGVKGGFAVGGYNSAGKGSATNFMSLTPQNYLIGEFAGENLTTGKNNSFLGYKAGYTNTTGSNNIFLGKRSGYSSVSSQENIFIGNGSGHSTVNGYGNVFLGNQSGFKNDGGYYNSFVGYQAGYASTTFYNTFFGFQAGYNNTSGKNNIAIGYMAGYGYPATGAGVTGGSNIFIGLEAGYQNTTGNNNVFMGTSSGFNNTTGTDNVFIGNSTGTYSADGSYNMYIGYKSGYNGGNGITGDPSYNTFLGYQSGMNNRSGDYNTYIGYNAGLSSTGASGNNNVAIGLEAGYANTSGSGNVFLGNGAGHSNTSGQNNVFMGTAAGYSNLTGSYNTILGFQAAYNLTGGATTWEGYYNTILGYQAGHDILKGYKNVIIGYQAGYRIRDNRYNILIGEAAGYNLIGELGNEFSGQSNIMIGLNTGRALTIGTSNIFIGLETGYGCSTDAEDNVWIGHAAGRSSASSGSVFIGQYAGYGESTDNKLIVQTGYTGTDNLNNALIYGDFSTDDLRFNATIGINRSDSELYGLMVDGGTSTNYSMIVYKGAYAYGTGFVSASDVRLKTDIQPIHNALNSILALQGVTFKWKENEIKNDTEIENIGLIAQDVEDVLPELVSENGDGYKGVAYDKLTAVLIEAVKEQQAEIERLKAEQANYEDLETKIKLLEERLNALEK